MSTETTTHEKSIDKRTIRAATEYMSIDRHAGGPGEYDVYSESGNVYRVNALVGTCECPSAEYQEGACKHQRRIELESGQREIPDLEGETDVEMMIAARDQYRGLGDSTVEHRLDNAVIVTDGGVATEARITGPFTEPIEQGGANYWQCSDCGRESLRRSDLEREEFHADGCAGSCDDVGTT